MSRPDRLAMVDRGHAAVSVRRQCAFLGVARAGVYRPAPAPGPEDLALMRRLDALYLEAPFYGSRRMVEALRCDGVRVGRHRVRRLMRLMGLEVLAPKPGASRPAPGHRIYPYRLRGLSIERPNQVWAADITYIPMARGFLYLVAIIDWFSRAVLAWRLSNTMDATFCSKRWRRRWRASASRRSSTAIRARSSPAPHSRPGSKPPASRSAWTGVAAGSTTSSSSGCGEA
jgi:putative transposase